MPGPLAVFFPLGRRFGRRLALTYALTLAEYGFRLLYPVTIGHAIDRLLAREPSGLLPLLAVWVAHIVVGLGRHLYDTRVFTLIYNELIDATVARQRALGTPAEVIASRVALSRELVDFVQVDVPAAMSFLVLFAGSVAMLFAYDPVIGVYALAALIPIALGDGWFARTSARLNAALNDRLEREVAIVTRQDLPAIARHLRRVRRWRIRISNAEAGAWGLIDVAVLALTVAALLRLTGGPGATPGVIYAVLAYVWDYYEGVGALPNVTRSVTRVRDIALRL